MPDFNDDIFFASIRELNQRLVNKEFSAIELTRAFCDRLEKSGPRYNALALPLREEALRQARDVDADLKKGRTRGPLQGIPWGAKDLLSVKGHPTTWGAKPYAGQVFKEDATVVKKLQKVGAILTGKLSMVELAGGGGYRYANASLFGPGLNPWDRSRWSGGSSSGSGSAVAAGLTTFAIGSETSGSILTPAAYCGITGLRPTYGLVSRNGAMALSWTLDKIGPMCRTAEDCGLVLSVIAGKDSDDPGSAGKGFYFAPQFNRPWPEVTVGFSKADFEEWADAETRPALAEALKVIQSLGVKVVDAKLPEMPVGPMVSTIIAAEAASIFEKLIASGEVDQLADKNQIAGLKAAMDTPARDYLKAMRIRRLLQDEFRTMFIDVDILVAPARYGIANKVSDPLDRGNAPRNPAPSSPGMRSLIPAGNLAGLPAISLPCGFAEKMPVGLQLVARPFNENLILGMGMEFQKRTDWHRQRPAVS